MRFFYVVLFFPLFAVSQESAPKPEEAREPAALSSPNMDPIFDEQIQEKVKHRSYSGGQDEGDLRVQVQLVTPVRKMIPELEEPAEAATHGDSD